MDLTAAPEVRVRSQRPEAQRGILQQRQDARKTGPTNPGRIKYLSLI